MIQLQILVDGIHKGHLGSDDVIRGHQQVFANNSRLKQLQIWAWSHCARLVKTHRLVCNMTYLAQPVTSRDLDLTSNIGLAIQGHQVHVSTRFDERNTMALELHHYLA